jgi:hypothetical protein
VLSLLIAAAAARGAAVPVLVSPGSAGAPAEIATPCPTFSWAPVTGASGQELVVYRVLESGDSEREPARRVALPGNVGSWTPSLGECLEPGSAYAWSVSADSPGAKGAWSEAGVFRISPAPSLEEVETALAVLERYRMSRAPEQPTVANRGEVAPPPGTSIVLPSTTPSASSTTPEQPTADGDDGMARTPATGSLTDDALFPFDEDRLLVEAEGQPLDLAAVRGLVEQNTNPDIEYWRAGVVGEVIGSADTGATSNHWGVLGVTNSQSGAGVRGDAVSSSGSATGILGITNSPDGFGGHLVSWGSGGTGLLVEALVNGVAIDASGSIALKATGLLVLTPDDAPATCISGLAGALYYDTGLNKVCYCDGSDWRSVVNDALCSPI